MGIKKVIHTFCTELSTKKGYLPTKKFFLTLPENAILVK